MTDDLDYRRPKGFAPWRPQAATRDLLTKISAVFDMYSEQLPLTARQVFYVLVGRHGYSKTNDAYVRLCEHLVRARRAGMIPFGHIRDDTTRGMHSSGFLGEDHFWDNVQSAIDHYRRHPSWEQPVTIEVWCETHGMIPQLSRVCSPYGASVYSNQGFTSVTANFEIARRVVRDYRPTKFLHIGDFDPSGVSVYEAMSEDVSTFVDQIKDVAASNSYEGEWMGVNLAGVDSASGFEYERVALVESQVTEYNLETAPPKASDKRSQKWVGDTCQAEAMPPDILARVVKEAVEKHYDWEAERLNRIEADKDRYYLKKDFKNIPGRNNES